MLFHQGDGLAPSEYCLANIQHSNFGIWLMIVYISLPRLWNECAVVELALQKRISFGWKIDVLLWFHATAMTCFNFVIC